MSPDRYDRLMAQLGQCREMLSASLRPGFGETPVGEAMRWPLGELAEALGLPDSFGVHDVDQAVAGLKAGALEQLTPADWDG
jgi:hypothetical protein